jgi:cytochrome P450
MTEAARASTTGTDLPSLDLNDPAFWQDINTPIAAAMEASPIARTTDGILYVLRHDEVEAVLKDPRFVAADLLAMMGMTDGPVWEWWQSLMFSKNPPEHTRLRTLVSRAFTPRSVERLRPRMRELTLDLLVRAFETGDLEVMGELAHHLPSQVMCEMMGIPERDREIFAEWTTDLGLAFSAALDPAVRARVEASLLQLDEYVRGLLAERRADPGDDLLSSLLAVEEGGDRLTTDELVALVENLLFAGHDTTRSAVGIAVWLLATWKDQTRLLLDDPALIDGAVEEILRFEAVTFSTSRSASEDSVVAGIEVEGGTPIGLCLPAASRDPRQYPEPDRFDIRRKDIRPPTFGAGVHYCLGAALGRYELQEMTRALVEHVTDIELVDPPARWLPFAHIRRFETLPVSLVLK